MGRVDPAKLAFVLAVLVAVFLYGVMVGVYRLFPYSVLSYAKDAVLQVYGERETLAKTRPAHFLQPARGDGDGVTRNDVPADRSELVLISGFFDGMPGLRLIRRDGTVVARWPARFSAIFPDPGHLDRPPATDWNIDIHGMVALPDGAVVFNFEYGGLVRLDRCGRVDWTLPRMTHHSLERAEGGGFWVPSRRKHARGETSLFPPFETPFEEDTVLRVSDGGEVLQELSVVGLMYENGLQALLTATGHGMPAGMTWDHELIHLNKAGELGSALAADFPLFQAGDLVLSLRMLNLVMVADPRTGTVRWWRTGPWLRQHDPEFAPGGRILVFNNNTFFSAFDHKTSVTPVTAPRTSTIVEVDPATGATRVAYGGRPGEEMLSVIRGKLESTPSGGLLVTEFEAGRVFETDAAGSVIWEYVNRYDADTVAEVTEARLYPESYFTVTDWFCDGGS